MRTRLLAGLLLAACSSTPELDSDAGRPNLADDEATEASSSAGSFVDVDLPPIECGQRCDWWEDDACPSQEKCVPVSCSHDGTWDTYACRPINGDQGAEEPCEVTGELYGGYDDCAAGSWCWDLDPVTQTGLCVANCAHGSPPTCSDGRACLIPGSTVPAMCPPSCDPFEPLCPADHVCLPHTEVDAGCVCVPGSDDPAGYGEPCESANACAAGLVCISGALVPALGCSSANGCCTPYCDLSLPNTCPGAGQVCEHVFDPQPAGYENVGVCAVPQP